MRSISMAAVVFCFFVTSSVSAFADETIKFKAKVRNGIKVDISVDVLNNPNQDCEKRDECEDGETVFAIHGIAHTGNTYRPFADALFNSVNGGQIDRVILFNAPNRGGSGLPKGSA